MNSTHAIWKKSCVVLLFLTFVIQSFSSAEKLTSTLSLKKCRCSKFQGWDGTTCHDAETIVPVYLKEPESKDGFDVVKHAQGLVTSQIENVMVTGLECPKGLVTSMLTNSILLLTDGRLLTMETMRVFADNLFCVDFFLKNAASFFYAEVCLSPPAVPRCCPANHVLDQSGSCHPREGLHVPPLHMEMSDVDWDSLNGVMTSPKCSKHEHHHHVSLSSGNASLSLSYPTAILNWRPPFWTSTHPWVTNYCVGLQEMETKKLQFVAQICWKDYIRYHQHQCDNNVCIRKCCPQNTLLSRDTFRCEPDKNQQTWNPSQIPGYDAHNDWEIVTGEPGCSGHSFFQFKLLSNGSLQLTPEKPSAPPSHYCIDNLMEDINTTTLFALVCNPPNPTECLWRDTMIRVIIGMSCVFLVATLIVYLTVGELRNHTYGRCLISMVSTMLTAFLCVLSFHTSIDNASCYVLAFMTHLSGLAVFFWLNVMCFDMWKILRGSTVQHHSRKVFLGYSLYAWGCPAVVSTVTLVLDITAPQGIILPGYLDGSCWFNRDEAYWAYFSGFIMVLVVVNIGFFIHVAVTLYQKMKQRTKNFQTNTSHTNKITKTKHQVWLFTKLFLVMGVVWIAEALSAVSHRKSCGFWLVTDIINGLQGVLIFIVAVCNKDNLKKIKDAWRPRIHKMSQRFSTAGMTSRRTTQNTLSIDDTEDSRKTSVTSLPRKISQASNIFFSSAKKSATLNPEDGSSNSHNERKSSNVSIKDIIPLSTMQE